MAKTKTMTRRLKTNLKVGDVFWLREPARVLTKNDDYMYFLSVEFLSDGKKRNILTPDRRSGFRYGSVVGLEEIPNGCIKEMARYFYRVISVHSEKLQEITFRDIHKEGYPLSYDMYGYETELFEWFKTLWNSTAKAPNRWEDNPTVQVIEYKRLEATE